MDDLIEAFRREEPKTAPASPKPARPAASKRNQASDAPGAKAAPAERKTRQAASVPAAGKKTPQPPAERKAPAGRRARQAASSTAASKTPTAKETSPGRDAAAEESRDAFEAAVAAAFGRNSDKADKTPAAAAGSAVVPGAGAAAGRKAEAPVWSRKKRGSRRVPPDIPRRPDPVTIGRDLRPDQMLVYDSELDEFDYTDDEDLPEVRDYMPIRFRRYGRVGVFGGILYALFVISASIVLACFLWMLASDVLALNKESKSAIVTIETYEPSDDRPATVTIDDEDVDIKVDIDQVAEALKSSGVIEYKWLFKLYSQFSHAETKIDPGTYDVTTELDYRAIVTALQFGSGSQEATTIMFPEGYSLEQIFDSLEANSICKKSDLYETAANYDFTYDFLEELELGDASRLEGYLFPDTYEFYQNESASVAINRFLRNLNSKLTKQLVSEAEERGLTVHELLTVASLIEKEAGSDEERAIMASIIYNRLNAGMPLQLDSTINYILGTSTLDITIEDTTVDSPYNTYLYTGLPPGPICNPGLASIQAAVEPESTNYWYWYAVDGVTHFFSDYDDFLNFQNENANS